MQLSVSQMDNRDQHLAPAFGAIGVLDFSHLTESSLGYTNFWPPACLVMPPGPSLTRFVSGVLFFLGKLQLYIMNIYLSVSLSGSRSLSKSLTHKAVNGIVALSH